MVIVALNDLKLEAGNMQNTYLTAPCLENIYATYRLDFGPDLQWKQDIIVRALYDLRSSSKAFRNHLFAVITFLL